MHERMNASQRLVLAPTGAGKSTWRTHAPVFCASTCTFILHGSCLIDGQDILATAAVGCEYEYQFQVVQQL